MSSKLNALVQSKWAEEQLPQSDAIVFGTGDVILMNCEVTTDPNSGRLSTSIAPAEPSSIESLVNGDDEIWEAVTVLFAHDWVAQRKRIYCGEGSMGNEGFIAVVDATTEALEWAAIFSGSNAFIRLSLQGPKIIAENNRDQYWIFPVESPQLVQVLDHFPDLH